MRCVGADVLWTVARFEQRGLGPYNENLVEVIGARIEQIFKEFKINKNLENPDEDYDDEPDLLDKKYTQFAYYLRVSGVLVHNMEIGEIEEHYRKVINYILEHIIYLNKIIEPILLTSSIDFLYYLVTNEEVKVNAEFLRKIFWWSE